MDIKDIWVTGYDGYVGSRLVEKGANPLRCDVTSPDEIRGALSLIGKPKVLVHCAAKTDINYCETQINDAINTNIRGTANLLGALDKDTFFVYLSTAYVFSGDKWYNYTEKHQPNPINIYGYSKWGGEIVTKALSENNLIIRISKIFHRKWLERIESRLQRNEAVSLYTFSKRSFVHLEHFIEGLLFLIENRKSDKIRNRTINLSGTDTVSYYRFWQAAAMALGYNPELILPQDHDNNLVNFPRNAGLSVDVARKIGVPLYSCTDGLELEKKLRCTQ